MSWDYDASMQAYCLVRGRDRCTIRRAGTGQWLAVTSAGGQGANAYSFDSRAETQAWCEARVAELSTRRGHEGRARE